MVPAPKKSNPTSRHIELAACVVGCYTLIARNGDNACAGVPAARCDVHSSGRAGPTPFGLVCKTRCFFLGCGL
jgi:hypothetical protein